MDTSSARQKNLIDDLDLLRGMAVLMVAVHHAGGSLFEWKTDALRSFYDVFSGGVGVDLFFAISGFIIAKDLLPRLVGCSTTPAWLTESLRFWVKRAYRIIPSAFFWLAAILLLCVVFNSTGVYGSFQVNVEATIAGVLQYANFRLAASFMQSPYGASFVYWSLSLEEQFYILLPFVAYFGRRYLVLILVAIVSIQLVQLRGILEMAVRTDALLLGVLIAIWSTKDSYRAFDPKFLRKQPWLGYLVMPAACFLLGALMSGFLHFVPLRQSFVALVSAALVLIASYNGNYFMPSGPLKHLVLWVGSRSYAIYLCHVPAFYFVRELMHRIYPDTRFDTDFFWLFSLSAIALIALCSELNYRILELPLRRRGARVAAEMYARRKDKLAVR